ncbi:MAG TPA: hypothetical protein VH590_18830, partial [Ktedonobacterales bacterium]
MNSTSSGAIPRLGSSGQTPSGPGATPGGAGAAPFSTPSMPSPTPRSPASRGPRGPRSSPYAASGRRSTDDLFASSSLINQNQLPEWLSPRPPRAQKPATPPAERGMSQRPAAPRPSAERPPDAERDAHLPDWLRAMDPGAPPDLSSLNSGSIRSGGRPSASSYRAPDRRTPLSGTTPGADPFSISRVDAALPPLEGFGPGDSGAARRPPTGNPDLFASRPPFGQPPSGQPQRPGDSFSGPQRPGGESSGSWRPERRSGPALSQSGGGFSAGSLIDKSGLPEWLQGPEQSASAPARPYESNPPSASRSFDLPQAGEYTPRGSRPSGSSSPSPVLSGPSPFDGASLVDEASLP